MYYATVDLNVYCSDIEEYYNLNVRVDCEDLHYIIPYLYEKHFNIPYRELGWWLEPGAREFVKDIEDKWFHNTLDTYELSRDSNFINYLVKNQIDDLLDEDVLDDLKDDVRYDLDCLSAEEKRDLIDDVFNSVLIEISFDNEVIKTVEVELPDWDEEDLEDEDDDF